MASKTRNVVEYTCDRCDCRWENVEMASLPHPRSRLTLKLFVGDKAGTWSTGARERDLCESCTTELIAWLKAAEGEEESRG